MSKRNGLKIGFTKMVNTHDLKISKIMLYAEWCCYPIGSSIRSERTTNLWN